MWRRTQPDCRTCSVLRHVCRHAWCCCLITNRVQDADDFILRYCTQGQGLEAALKSDVAVLFLLYGDILTIGETIARIHQAGKRAFVHLDLIDGLSAREISADFIARHTAADGVISTKSALTKRARELGLVSIQRVFLLDSMALNNVERHFSQESADLVEVLPGLMPKIIRQLCRTTGKPIIAGGLISDKEDVTGALGAGAVAVSSTNPAVWAM